MEPALLKERLLSVMDEKDHWAWLHLTRPGLTRAQLFVHFRHEYHVYVRDFPMLLARVLGQGPPEPARRALAENIYEEQTGKLSLGVPHPELFLEMMEGLGFLRESFESLHPPLEPEATAYRNFLEGVSARSPWVVGAAVLTIFVEGSKHERAELAGRRLVPSIEDAIASHPVCVHYGCPPERMRLVRAHRLVEGSHRTDAWSMLLDDAALAAQHGDRVVSAVEEARRCWFAYRDGVARAMGIACEPSPAPSKG